MLKHNLRDLRLERVDMGMQSDLVVAREDEAAAIAASSSPTSHWQGLSFAGLDNVSLCTLVCLVQSGSPDQGFDEALDRIQVVATDAGEFADVWLIPNADVATLARIATLGIEAFDELLTAWCNTDELNGWDEDDTRELLREIGDLADNAQLSRKLLLLRMGP